MNDLILFAGCTLGGALVGAGIAGCIIWHNMKGKMNEYEVRISRLTQDVLLHSSLLDKQYNLLDNEHIKVLKAWEACGQKKPRENGTVAKIRRILEGEG